MARTPVRPLGLGDKSARIQGLKDFQKAMAVLDEDAKKDFRNAAKRAVIPFLEEARRQVPRQSGRLASTVKPVTSSRHVAIKAGGPSVPYAAVVHFGWGRRGRPQTPYFFRAVSLTIDEVRDIYEQEIEGIWNRYAAKAEAANA